VAWLVRNGIDLDVALRLPDPIRAAFAINFSQFEGGKFNFNTFEFEDPKE
jgi:hypothetical protein